MRAADSYEALTSGAALFDLGAWGRLRFAGPDARSYLNGLLTNDVARLPARRGFPVCLLTPKGRAQAEFLLYDCDGPLLALARPEAAGNVRTGLGKMIMLSETKMEDLAGTTSLLLLAGPRAPQVLATVFGAAPPRDWAWSTLGFAGAQVELCSYPRFQQDAVLIVPPAGGAAALSAALQAAGARPGDDETLETWRVERGIPAFGRELDGETIPLEARLEEAISYTKGCYMGQETISRIHHLGHVNRILAALKLAGGAPPAAGAEVTQDGWSVGKVTSACVSPKLKGPLALAMVKVDAAKPGARLKVADVEADVVDLGVWG